MVGPFLDLLPFKGPFPLTGALTGRPPYGNPLRADRLTGRPLTGCLVAGNTFNYRKAYGKLRGGILPELGRNFCLCAVDQKKPFFLAVGPFLDLLPFKGPFPLTGAVTGREASYGKAPYELQESLREATGRGLYQSWAGISACVP